MNIITYPAPTAQTANASSGVEVPIRHSERSVSWGSPESIGQVTKQHPLPPKGQDRLLRHARHTFINVYRRLFSLIFIINLVGAAILVSRMHQRIAPPLNDLATATSANILLAVLIRQDYVINLIYRVCWSVPHRMPLGFRRMLAKCYEFGGIHSGAAVCSVIWFAALTGCLTQEVATGLLSDPAIMTLTYVLLCLFFALVITALPAFRVHSHNTFENIHRWAGWFSIALFWAEVVLFSRTLHRETTTKTLGLTIIELPAFWCLLITSFHIILPWLRYHKITVTPERLSDHAIKLHFKEPIGSFVTLRISDAPLKEWHAFACIPNRKGGGSIVISDAGDWTRKTIDNPKEYYYVKGIPITGLLCMAQVFRKVIVVTTGSGIGPCLGVMLDLRMPTRVLWSTQSPLRTFGQDIIDSVYDVDPHAVIIDTKISGRPDLVDLTYRMYVEFEAEAVFCISNAKVTRKVVYGMESRGVPAYGPIFDS